MRQRTQGSPGATGSGEPARPPLDSGRRRALQWLGVVVVFSAATFGFARTLRWPAGCLALAIVLAGLFFQDVHVRRRNPGLMERRRQRRPGTPWWDVTLVVSASFAGWRSSPSPGWTGGDTTRRSCPSRCG